MRVALASALLLLTACGSDQSTNTNPGGPTTAAQLALHFDSLTAALEASSPSDIRITWYQEIGGILARGVAPSTLSGHVNGGPAVDQALTEIDQIPDTVNANTIADSTLILAAWNPKLRPTTFLNVRIRFFHPDTVGKPEVAKAFVRFYLDTLGRTEFDSTAGVFVSLVNSRGGACTLMSLQHINVPTGPCQRVTLDWEIGGGEGLASFAPAVQVSGILLTH